MLRTIDSIGFEGSELGVFFAEIFQKEIVRKFFLAFPLGNEYAFFQIEEFHRLFIIRVPTAPHRSKKFLFQIVAGNIRIGSGG